MNLKLTTEESPLRNRHWIAATALFCFVLFVDQSRAADTPHDQVVSEFIRQMAAIHELQETAARELKASDNQIMDSIRASTRIIVQLRRDIAMLKSMTLGPPYETLLPTVIQLYHEKISLHDDLIIIATEFPRGPQPNVDYGKLSAATPQIAATIEYVEKMLFQTTPMFCFLLLDDRADNKGKLSHLNITKARRREMIKEIDDLFGHRLSAKDTNFAVSSAVLIKKFLVGGHKSADDPW
jgi:hypothetical protein